MVYNHKEMDNIINNMHMVKCLFQYNKKQLDNKVINKCKNQKRRKKKIKIKIKKKRLRKRILLFLMINNNRMFKINLKVSFFNPTKTKHNKVNFNKNHNSHNTISNNKTK